MRSYSLAAAAVATLGLALCACSGDPTSPSSTTADVMLRGVVLGQGTASSEGVRAMSGTSGITVTVQENTSITTTVSANGTFELKGLPAGTVTLVFSMNGVPLGTITITSVPTQAEIDVVVQITSSTVVVVKIEINGTDTTDNDNGSKTCLIEGGRVGAGIELEGSVSAGAGTSFQMSVNGQRADGLVGVDASGASFSCAGVKGACNATLIKAGARVHVSGNLSSCSPTEAQVRASNVKFQH